jgi:putative tryptophan/tyrosine transport system substrate-binding protein
MDGGLCGVGGIRSQRRRSLLRGISCLALYSCFTTAAWAASAKRVGVLFYESKDRATHRESELRARLSKRAAGSYEVTVFPAYGDRDRSRITDLATKFVRERVDVLLAIGTSVAVPAFAAIQQEGAGDRTALVFVAANPVQLGLAQDISRPGGFATGIGGRGLELTPKRLELLTEILRNQGTARISVGVLYDEQNPAQKLLLPMLDRTGAVLGIKLPRQGCTSVRDYLAAINAMAPETNAFYIAGVSWRYGERGEISQLSRHLKKPVVFSSGEPASDGGLFSYLGETDPLLAVEYVHRILGGARASELPIYVSDRTRFILNKAAADGLGLRIPHHLKNFADAIVNDAPRL